MIQRVQSLYFLLGALALFLVFVFDMVVFKDLAELRYHLSALSFYQGEEQLVVKGNMIMNLLLALGGGVMLGNILMFKNRSLQRSIGRLIYILILAIIGCMFYFIITNQNSPEVNELSVNHYSVGFYLPFFALIMTFMANRGIRRDEQLVASLDRLR